MPCKTARHLFDRKPATNLPYITQIDRLKWEKAQSVGRSPWKRTPHTSCVGIYSIPISPWSWPSRAKAGIVSISASTVVFCPPSYTLPVRRSVHVMLAFPGSVTSRDLAPASTTGPLGYQGRTCIHRRYQTPTCLEGTRRRVHGPKAGHRYVLIRTVLECKGAFSREWQ